MKYLLPDFILICIALLFPEYYVNACVIIFQGFHKIFFTSFFLNYTFLAFPLMNLLFFIFFGYVRHSFIGNKKLNSIGIRNFLKQNFIFIVVIIVYLLQLNDALNEAGAISPNWPLQLDKLSLLFDLVSAFFLSSVLIHISIQLKAFLQHRSI